MIAHKFSQSDFLLKPKLNSETLTLGAVENTELNLQDLSQFSDEILLKIELSSPELLNDPASSTTTPIQFNITPKNVKNKKQYTLK